MKALHFFLLLTLITCFLATSEAAFRCYECYSSSPADPSCSHIDLGEVKYGCEACTTIQWDVNRYSRKCYPKSVPIRCGVVYGQPFCNCDSDLCNGNDDHFKNIVKCHVCASTSTTDTHCTATDLGEVSEGCLSCATTKLDANRFTRECLPTLSVDSCTVKNSGEQMCLCNSDLCNAKDIFKPLIKCHQCESKSDNDALCTAFDLGVVKDDCVSCGVLQLGENRFIRQCLKSSMDDTCRMVDRKQFCGCNKDLCTAHYLFKNVIECYDCRPLIDNGKASCTTENEWRKLDKCLSCYTAKVMENVLKIGCSAIIMPEGCSVINNMYNCVCDTDLCNSEDVYLADLKCYTCLPKSDNDTTCNIQNSGEKEKNCKSCGTTVNAEGLTTRSCFKYAVAPFTKIVNGSTLFNCNTDLCNGEGEAKIVKDSSNTCGLQKTVSSRVLIGGVLLAMLGLARFF